MSYVEGEVITCDECGVELSRIEAAENMVCRECWDKQMQEWKKEQEHLEWEYWKSVL